MKNRRIGLAHAIRDREHYTRELDVVRAENTRIKARLNLWEEFGKAMKEHVAENNEKTNAILDQAAGLKDRQHRIIGAMRRYGDDRWGLDLVDVRLAFADANVDPAALGFDNWEGV